MSIFLLAYARAYFRNNKSKVGKLHQIYCASVATRTAYDVLRMKKARPHLALKHRTHSNIYVSNICFCCLQCFDAVSWAAGRAPGL